MLTIILQSCAAGVAFALGALATLTLAVFYRSQKDKNFQADVIRRHAEIEERLLRSAIAHEDSALALARIADQLEKNGK